MRYVIENVEAEKLSDEIGRRGVAPHQRLRVVVDTLDDEIPITEMNVRGGGFTHLGEEPEIYDDADLVERNETFGR
jgi:hypothetical protein